MEITYSKCGDYQIPDLSPPEGKYNIGKYGSLRRTFLKEHRRGTYYTLLLNGTLLQHLSDIDKACQNEMDTLIPTMAKNEGITEELKEINQIKWIQSMNNIHNRAEEV